MQQYSTAASDHRMTAPTIVFDLDGTLVDTAPDLVETLNVIFAREGFALLPYEMARNFVGGGAKAMIARGLATMGHTVSPERIEKLSSFLASTS